MEGNPLREQSHKVGTWIILARHFRVVLPGGHKFTRHLVPFIPGLVFIYFGDLPVCCNGILSTTKTDSI